MSENGTSKTIELPGSINVRELSQRIGASPIQVIKSLMDMGVIASINQQVDFDTASLVVAEMGFEAVPEAQVIAAQNTQDLPLWRRVIAEEDRKNLVRRPPVVTILGHVDHGKTTLLDAIRKTNVAQGEAGGITQHIAAYQVEHQGRLITFLDTPGHAAFTAMRARGAQGADVVVLVVAADDGVMPQTREAIAHAKAAQVPIVVALNKIDKPNANPDRVKQQLAELDLIPDDWDGSTIVVPLSAKQRKGLEDLLEAILLVSDNLEILANPRGKTIGTVIEAERDRAKGVLATLLVQNGTLKSSDTIVAGTSYGKLRAMFDFRARKIREAGPSMPLSVMGLNDVPSAGDVFEVVANEREARQIVAERLEKQQKQTQERRKMTLEQFFDRVQSGEMRELRLILKADVQGSIDPIVASLNDLSKGETKINILHTETGKIGENDVMLASASEAVVVGFNVEADVAARRLAESEGVSIRTYTIIYRLIEDVEKALKGMLEPEYRPRTIGRAQVRAVFRISKIGNIAGSYVLDGELRRNAKARLLRGGKVVYEGEFSSIKHHQDDVKEIRQGFECGINLRDFEEYHEGDLIECYVMERVDIL